MAAFTSKATGNWNTTGQTTWNEVGAPGAGDTVTIQNTHVVTQVQNEASASLTVDNGGTWAQSTFNQACSGNVIVNGTHTGGASADAGLTSVDLTYGATADKTGLNVETKLQSSGNIILDGGGAKKGRLIKTGNGTYSCGFSARPRSIEINNGVTMSPAANSYLCANEDFKLHGTAVLAVGANTIHIDPSATVLFDTNCDITGNGLIKWGGRATGATVNKTADLTYTGTWSIQVGGGSSVTTFYQPALPLKNADIEFIPHDGEAKNLVFEAGDQKMNAFTLTQDYDYDIEVDDSANPNIIAYGTFVAMGGSGTYTGTWTRGTGYIEMASGFNRVFVGYGLIFEQIRKTGGGDIEQANDHTCHSFVGTAGGWRSNSAGVQKTMTVQNKAPSICSNFTFRDISAGAKDMINAKDTCTNNGNNLGIIFRDRPINVMM